MKLYCGLEIAAFIAVKGFCIWCWRKLRRTDDNRIN